MDFALTDVFILVKNRLFSQKTSRKFYGKSCQISAIIDKSFSELFSFQYFTSDYSSPPPFDVVRYAEGVTPVKSLNAFDIEDASGKPVSAAMSSNVIFGSVCRSRRLTSSTLRDLIQVLKFISKILFRKSESSLGLTPMLSAALDNVIPSVRYNLSGLSLHCPDFDS